VDAPFPQLLIASDVAAGKDGSGKNGVWEVQALAKAIRQIPGVLEVGIFTGLTGPEATKYSVKGGKRPVACYFGMSDGTVTVRKAPSKDPADFKDSS
jgi:ribose 5-phosphate isomerase A